MSPSLLIETNLFSYTPAHIFSGSFMKGKLLHETLLARDLQLIVCLKILPFCAQVSTVWLTTGNLASIIHGRTTAVANQLLYTDPRFYNAEVHFRNPESQSSLKLGGRLYPQRHLPCHQQLTMVLWRQRSTGWAFCRWDGTRSGHRGHRLARVRRHPVAKYPGLVTTRHV